MRALAFFRRPALAFELELVSVVHETVDKRADKTMSPSNSSKPYETDLGMFRS